MPAMYENVGSNVGPYLMVALIWLWVEGGRWVTKRVLTVASFSGELLFIQPLQRGKGIWGTRLGLYIEEEKRPCSYWSWQRLPSRLSNDWLTGHMKRLLSLVRVLGVICLSQNLFLLAGPSTNFGSFRSTNNVTQNCGSEWPWGLSTGLLISWLTLTNGSGVN